MTITDAIHQHQVMLKIQKSVGADLRRGQYRAAWVVKVTDMPDLSTCPKEMRLIVRMDRP